MSFLITVLNAYAKKGEGKQLVTDESIPLEVIEVENDKVTIGFDYGDARLYLQFKLGELVDTSLSST